MAERDSGSFVLGFVIGAVTGVVLGLLFAPRPGEETRQILKEKARDIKEQVTEAVKKVRGSVAEVAKRAQEKV
jgi:gas vesicle protein